jgi:hypothetical protein
MKRYFFTVLILILAGTSSCYANAGLPMLAIMWPLLFLAFIPIVLIESYVLRRYLRRVEWRESLKVCTYSNLFSTLIGIPLTWAVLVVVEIFLMFLSDSVPLSDVPLIVIFIVESPWLVPKVSDWSIPLAGMLLLIPFYFASIWSEHLIVRRLMGQSHNDHELKKAVYAGNQASYGFLLVILLLILVYILMAK